MRERGVKPAARQWVWCVEPTALCPVPVWARQKAVRGLGQAAGRVWMWPTDARALMREICEAGWRCQVVKVELRHCQVCGRPLLGTEAERRRRLDESGPAGRSVPCGTECERDRASGLWRKLTRFQGEQAA